MSVWSLLITVALAQRPSPSADELIQKLDAHGDLKGREKPFEISASLARLYFSQGRLAEALGFSKEALTTADAALTFFVELSAKYPQLTPTAQDDASCAPTPPAESSLSGLLELARRHEKERKPGAAKACARRAIAPVQELLLLDGNARFVSRDLAGARASYERVLTVFGDVPEARYARGALTFDERPDDLKALEDAKRDLEAFLAAAPAARQAPNAKALLARATAALAAGGASKLERAPVPAQPTSPPPLDSATIAAFQNAPKTPESEARFAKLIEDGEDALAGGRYQDALDGFKQVMPFQPENPRLRAGMAWSLVRLGKPMGDNVWRVAAQSPEALDALGDRLKAKGDADGAKALWTKLAQTVPAYAAKVEAKK